MKTVASIIPHYFPDWNKRNHTELDGYEFCDRYNIIIHETLSIADLGEYRIHKGQPFILLHKYITSRFRTWVLFHEIAHFILHPTTIAQFSDEVTKRKAEKEANIVSAVLMMSKPFINTKTLAEIQDELGCARKLILIRKEIADSERI